MRTRSTSSSSASVLALLAAVALAGDRVDLFGDPLPRGATARLGTVRFVHPERVSLVGFGNGTVVSLDDGGTAIEWDLSGKELRRRRVSPRIGWVARGRLALVDDEGIEVVDLEKGVVGGFTFEEDEGLLAVAADGLTVAMHATLTQSVLVRETLTGRVLAARPYAASIVAVAGDLVAGVDEDGIRVGDRVVLPNTSAEYLGLSPDGKKLAVRTSRRGEDGSAHAVLRIYGVASGILEASFEDGEAAVRGTFLPGGHYQVDWDAPPVDAYGMRAFSPRHVAIVRGSTLSVVERATGRPSISRRDHAPVRLEWIGERLAAWGAAGVDLWDPRTSSVAAVFTGQVAAIASDGSFYVKATLGTEVWNARGELETTLEGSPVGLSPDGRRVAIAKEQRFVDWRTGASSPFEREAWRVEFSPANDLLLYREAAGVSVVENGRKLWERQAWGSQPIAEEAAFSLDGRLVGLLGRGKLVVHDAFTGEELGLVHARTFAFGPRRLATAVGETIVVRDERLVEVATIHAPTPVRCLAFSEHGLASAHEDTTILLWEVP